MLVEVRGQLPQRFGIISASANSYKGDLSATYKNWSSGVHVSMVLNKRKNWNGCFSLMFGNVVAQNADYVYDSGSVTSATPNKFSNTSLVDISYQLRYYLLKKNCLWLYVYQGIGLLRFQPKDEQKKPLIDQLSTRPMEESYSNVSFQVPHGIGALYMWPQGYGAGIQAGYINSTSDYLDNISAWGMRKKTDNIFTVKFMFYFPIYGKTLKGTPDGASLPVEKL